MGHDERIAALREALRRHPEGLTCGHAATLIDVPLRTARRYLADLHTAGEAQRQPVYEGTPPVFGWLYTAAAP